MDDFYLFENNGNNITYFLSDLFEEKQSCNFPLNNSLLLDSNNNLKFNCLEKDSNGNNKENEIQKLSPLSDKNLLFIETPNNIDNNNKPYYCNNNEENKINCNSLDFKSSSNKIQEINLKIIDKKKDKKEKIFKIWKKNLKKGRIKKNTNYIGRHNKFSEDNIIRKIKRRFLEKCRIYINNEYKKFLLNSKDEINKNSDFLQRITPQISKNIKKEDNILWLNSKLSQVYSQRISEKCSIYDPEYNKKKIKKLYEENKAKNVIDILNKTVKEMFAAFIQNTKISGFETLNDDLEELQQKMEKDNQDNIKLYLYKYMKIAQNFEYIFINKIPRTNKSSYYK